MTRNQRWYGVPLDSQLKDYAAFVSALRTGKLDDRLDYER